MTQFRYEGKRALQEQQFLSLDRREARRCTERYAPSSCPPCRVNAEGAFHSRKQPSFGSSLGPGGFPLFRPIVNHPKGLEVARIAGVVLLGAVGERGQDVYLGLEVDVVAGL